VVDEQQRLALSLLAFLFRTDGPYLFFAFLFRTDGGDRAALPFLAPMAAAALRRHSGS